MNCKRAQEEISGALASGEWELARELGQHLQGCAGCRAFRADQAILFQLIDARLRSLANEPVPPSLLPGVRVRLEGETLPRGHRIRTWQLAAIAALVVLFAAVSIPLRRSGTPQVSSTPTVASGKNNATPSRATVRRAPMPALQPVPPHVTPKAGVAKSSSTPVIVLREEQEAYARFVNDLSKDRDAALALAFAEPAGDETPVEIALLAIKSVEVKPLEGTDSQ
jgi:hypothetical protein